MKQDLDRLMAERDIVAFVVEATGRLSSDALRLVKLACAESKNPLLLHDFVTQVGGAIARYNAMAA